MNNSDVLTLFFTRSYEKQLNEAILDDIDYDIDQYGLLNYVANVLAVPYSEYLAYIAENANEIEVESRHITQSSSFDACEREMIDVFLAEDNRGLSFVDIGKHFTQYIRSDKDGAFRKYGENQVKTAEQLGLVYEYFNRWYLNCTGYIYNELSIEDQHSLLARNLLRDPLYSKMMLDIQEGDIDLLSYMDCIDSDETKRRRYDSVKRLLLICLLECMKEGVNTFSIIDKKKALKETKRSTNIQRFNIERTEVNTSIIPYEYREEEVAVQVAADDSTAFYETPNDQYWKYKKQFLSLKCYQKDNKPAPYKALMLLSVINLITRGQIKDNCITANDELRTEYRYLASVMKYDRNLFNPPFDTPFIHLSGEPFWHIKRAGNFIMQMLPLTKISQIERVILDDELFKLLKNNDTQKLLRIALIEKYLNG